MRGFPFRKSPITLEHKVNHSKKEEGLKKRKTKKGLRTGPKHQSKTLQQEKPKQ
jgi:hypothetical protein